MSAYEVRVIYILSRVMERGWRNDWLYSPSVVSVLSLGKSIHHVAASSSLRMINSLDSSPSLNWNTSLPSRMEVNMGRSIHHSPDNPITLKYDTWTITECLITKQKRFQTGQVYSSFHFITATLQFQRSILEIDTLCIQFSHFNHFQAVYILNYNRFISIERPATHLQFSQLLTILQIETVNCIMTRLIHLLTETTVTNDHTLQLR